MIEETEVKRWDIFSCLAFGGITWVVGFVISGYLFDEITGAFVSFVTAVIITFFAYTYKKMRWENESRRGTEMLNE